jgi:hypothetical protein
MSDFCQYGQFTAQSGPAEHLAGDQLEPAGRALLAIAVHMMESAKSNPALADLLRWAPNMEFAADLHDGADAAQDGPGSGHDVPTPEAAH